MINRRQERKKDCWIDGMGWFDGGEPTDYKRDGGDESVSGGDKLYEVSIWEKSLWSVHW